MPAIILKKLLRLIGYQPLPRGFLLRVSLHTGNVTLIYGNIFSATPERKQAVRRIPQPIARADAVLEARVEF